MRELGNVHFEGLHKFGLAATEEVCIFGNWLVITCSARVVARLIFKFFRASLIGFTSHIIVVIAFRILCFSVDFFRCIDL